MPLVRSTGFTVALASDIADFDTVGTVITYTATVTNLGNQGDAPDSVTVTGVALTCAPAGSLLPGESTSCTGGLTTTSGADVIRTATVTWDAESATSAPVTVTWTAAPAPSPTTPPAPKVVSPGLDGLASTGGSGPGLWLLGALFLGLGALLKAASAHEGL